MHTNTNTIIEKRIVSVSLTHNFKMVQIEISFSIITTLRQWKYCFSLMNLLKLKRAFGGTVFCFHNVLFEFDSRRERKKTQ